MYTIILILQIKDLWFKYIDKHGVLGLKMRYLKVFIVPIFSLFNIYLLSGNCTSLKL